MECWVSKEGKKDEFITEEIVEKYSKMKIRFWYFWKRLNFDAFFRPGKLKTEILFKKL